MLVRRQPYRHGPGDLQTEHMFHIVRRARGVPMSPLRIDFVDVAEVPVHNAAMPRGVDPGFLQQLARRRRGQGFTRLLASGHRLPMIAEVRSFEQQHVQTGIVDNDQR